jgi:hypothetical protein
MKRDRTSIDILEEAVALLRAAPLETAVTYLIGAAPFTLAFLFFLADMNRSPYASEHLPWASLSLALLYVWKNAWQAVFMAKLYYQVSPSETRISNPWQAILMQATLQPCSCRFPYLGRRLFFATSHYTRLWADQMRSRPLGGNPFMPRGKIGGCFRSSR